MEQLAWAISQNLHTIADYYIDLHSGDDYEQLTPYVYYAGKAAEEVVAVSRQMAEQVEQITAQNMETAWNVARQGGYEDVSLLATQEFEQIFVLKK